MSTVLSAVAWPYANGPRHIGHVAGFGVPSDVFSRYMRMAGHDVLMVSGSDEHGTPDPDRRRRGGGDAAGAGGPQPPDDRRGPRRRSGCTYDLYTRTTTRNHHAVVQELFLGVYENGYFVEQTTLRRDLAVHRPHAARPLHRGHLPDLRVRRGARRPVRQLRQPARPGRPDRTRGSKINGETPEFVETQHFFLDLPALADALGEWLDEREATGLWRPNVIRFSQNILKEIRPRAMTRDIDWGIAVPLDGWRDNPTKRLYVWFDAVIGYLSASIEWARRSGDPDALARVVERPRGPVLLLHGQGQHHLPQPDLARRAAGLLRQGRAAAAAADTYGELNLPTEVVSSRVPHDGGQEVLLLQAGRHLRARPAQPLPARRASATSSPPPARRTRTPTSPGRSSCAAPTTSWSPAGATWSTAPPP